ncbi:MAG: 4Fe-4S dicluster domain-containing protein, partial [Candidatus Bipolaricaulota bacterium]
LEWLDDMIPAVKIAAEGGLELTGKGVSWEKEEPANLRELLYLGGVTGFGQTGIPTEFNSSYFPPDSVNSILINGVRISPFARHLVNYGDELSSFKKGLRILARSFPDAQLHFALDEETYREMEDMGSGQRIKVHAVSGESYLDQSKYLARDLLGVEGLDAGGFLLEHGILALDELVPLLTYRVVEEGVPFVRNRFSLTGPGANSALYEVPIGSSLGRVIRSDISTDGDYVNILGGALTGIRLDDLDIPVGKGNSSLTRLEEPKETDTLAWIQTGLTKNSYTNAFLSALFPDKKKKSDAGLHGEERPCVYCGYCSEVCPVDILPFQIYKTHTHDMVDEVNRLQPQRCVDCGLCSYVCPSKLPLSETLKDAKKSQPGEIDNYVKYEETEEGLKPAELGLNQDRGEDVE